MNAPTATILAIQVLSANKSAGHSRNSSVIALPATARHVDASVASSVFEPLADIAGIMFAVSLTNKEFAANDIRKPRK
jgi:hypothetical protein